MKTFSFDAWLRTGGDAALRKFSLDDSYERVCWVYSCINRIAITASSAPLVFFEGDPETDKKAKKIVDKKHPVHLLFNPPCFPEINSLGDLLSRTFIHLNLDGVLYWVVDEKPRKKFDILFKTKNQIVPVFSKSGNLISFLDVEASQRTNKNVFLSINNVMQISFYNPKDPFKGLSPLHAARLSVESEFNIAAWNSSFFRSGMKNPILIKSKSMLTEKQEKDIRTEILNYYSGIDGAHGALLLKGALEIEPLTVNPKDVDFLQGKKLNREEIGAIYGVPPALIGIFEYANYSNVREQIKIFWDNTLTPRMNSILRLIQINILDRHFPGIFAKWDLSQISGLQTDPNEIADSVKTYLECGIPLSQLAKLFNQPLLDPDTFKDKYRPEMLVPRKPTESGSDKPSAAPVKPGASTNVRPAPTTNPKPKPKKIYERNLLDLKGQNALLARLVSSVADYMESGFSESKIKRIWEEEVLFSLQEFKKRCEFLAEKDAIEALDNCKKIKIEINNKGCEEIYKTMFGFLLEALKSESPAGYLRSLINVNFGGICGILREYVRTEVFKSYSIESVLRCSCEQHSRSDLKICLVRSKGSYKTGEVSIPFLKDQTHVDFECHCTTIPLSDDLQKSLD